MVRILQACWLLLLAPVVVEAFRADGAEHWLLVELPDELSKDKEFVVVSAATDAAIPGMSSFRSKLARMFCSISRKKALSRLRFSFSQYRMSRG